MKGPSPHLKLYANLPPIQRLNLMTAPAFAALLRVLQHKQINIMIDLVNFTIICNSTKEKYIFISCVFYQLYMTHIHGSSCTLPSIWCQILYPVLMLDQHSHFKRFISRLSTGFIKTIHCTSQYNCARMKLDLCNKPEEVCSQLCSCGSSENLRLDLKRVQNLRVLSF